MSGKKNFLAGAFVLGAAGVVSKLLGAVYRIPLARLLGGEGMGLYQMAYPIYTTILSLATAGIPVAISIMVAQKETQGLREDIERIFKVSLLLLFLVGMVLSLAVFGGSGWLAEVVLKQKKAQMAIAAIAPAILLSGLMSVFRGYFQGQQKMTPTAVSQVVEQVFRVTFVLILAFWLYPRGLEWAAAGATFGAVIGGIAGLTVLVFIYLKEGNRRKRKSIRRTGQSSLGLAKEVFRLAIPVSLGAVVVPLVQMLDAVIVPTRLIQAGFSVSRATTLYGELSGMASVLINLPTIFTIAIATSLVPAVAEAVALNNRHEIKKRINNGLRAALIIALPSAAGLYVLAFPICDLLYATPEAGIPLAYLAFSIVVLALFQVTSAGLQGLGHPKIPLRHLIVTGFLKVFFNYYLTGLVFLNIKGPAIGTTVAFLVGSCLNLIYLAKMTETRFEWGRYVKLVAVTLIMAAAVRVGYQFFITHGLTSHLSTLVAIGCGVAVYGAALLLFKELDLAMLKGMLRFG